MYQASSGPPKTTWNFEEKRAGMRARIASGVRREGLIRRRVWNTRSLVVCEPQ